MPNTDKVRPVDGTPLSPFCTVTVKLPPGSVMVPASCVKVALANALFGTVQGFEFVQPGPSKITIALFGSKPVPAIVNVNGCAANGGSGEVLIVLSSGAPGVPETTNLVLFDVAPLEF